MAADLDGLCLGVEAEPGGDDVGGAATTDRCEPPEPLAVQVLDLFLSERAHGDLLAHAAHAATDD